MDGTAIWIAVLQAVATIVVTVVGVVWAVTRKLEKFAVAIGKLGVRVEQVEKRLDGNGESLPSRCVLHGARLDEYERRLDKAEL